MMTSEKLSIQVCFALLYETHDREEFQNQGHSIPALRERDAEGNPTRNPREWGPTVYALTLLGPDGEPAKVPNTKTGKLESMCRSLSDSYEDAMRLLEENIRDTFWANKKAIELISFNAEQLRKATDDRTRLLNTLLNLGMKAEVADALSIPRGAVEDFVNAESNPAFREKVRKMERGE